MAQYTLAAILMLDDIRDNNPPVHRNREELDGRTRVEHNPAVAFASHIGRPERRQRYHCHQSARLHHS